MSMTGMKLKDTQVALLLSSRAEMQKVIEKARAAAAGFQMSKASQPSAATETFTNQFSAKKVSNNVAKQPATVASNYMQAQQQKPVSYQVTPNNIPGLGGAAENATNPNMPMYYNDYMKLVNQQQKQQLNVDPRSRDPREQTRHRRSSSRERRERSRSPYSNDEKKERKRKTRFSSPEKTATAGAAPTSIPSQLNLLQLQQQQLMQQQQNVSSFLMRISKKEV